MRLCGTLFKNNRKLSKPTTIVNCKNPAFTLQIKSRTRKLARLFQQELFGQLNLALPPP